MQITVVITWDGEEGARCRAVSPEFGIEAAGRDPEEAKANLSREIQIWMLRTTGGWPVKASIHEIDVPVPRT